MIVAPRRGALFAVASTVAFFACAPGGASSWEEYRSAGFAYTIAYPGAWTLVEARPRDPEMVSKAEFLARGELEKLTFLGPPGGASSGWFQLRVLPNPDRRTLDEWLKDFRLPNLSFVNMTDTTLAGLPAKRWTRYAYDLIYGEFVAVSGDRAYHLAFDVNDGEDPELEAHQEVYRRMVESFAVTEP